MNTRFFYFLFACSTLASSCLNPDINSASQKVSNDLGECPCIMDDAHSLCECFEEDQSVGENDLEVLEDATASLDHLLDQEQATDVEIDHFDLDLNILDTGIICDSQPEVCDDQDNDCDGEIDESISITSLFIRFSNDSIIDPEYARLELLGEDGIPIVGSPFIGDELRNRTITVPGHQVRFIYTVDAQGRRFNGYRVIEVTDQTGRLIDGSYPFIEGESAIEVHPIPLLDEQEFVAANSIGTGLPCGETLGECSIGLTSCFAGQVICRNDIRPQNEICDGLDNDCDGVFDEQLPPNPCMMAQGVCASTEQICDGEEGWRPCTVDQYGLTYEVQEISCDCLDNDCDGLVDENEEGDWLSCAFDEFQQGETSDCVLRESSTVNSGEYHFRSLTLAEDVSLSVIADSSSGFPSNTPCHTNIYPMNPYPGGGGLYVYANELRFEEGSRVDASAPNSTFCERNSSWIGVLGASGGDIHLLAKIVYLNGTLSAHGGAGSPWGSRFGGTAGSVQIYTNQLTLAPTSRISAYGGLAIARERHGVSGPGPGAGSENPNAIGAALEGEGDPERSIRLTGELIIENEEESLIESRNGNMICDGLVDLWGASIIAASQTCSGLAEYPESSLLLQISDVSLPTLGLALEITDIPSQIVLGSCRLNHYHHCNIFTTLVNNRPYQIKQILEPNHPNIIMRGLLSIEYGDRPSGLVTQFDLEWGEGELEQGLSFEIGDQ